MNELQENKSIILNSKATNLRIIRKSNNFLNTRLNLSHFSFNIKKPNVVSKIGGDTENLFVDDKVFLSDYINENTTELLNFEFEENVNFFRLNGFQLLKSKNATFEVKIKKAVIQILNREIDNINITDVGYGFEGNKSFPISFSFQSGGVYRLPVANALTNNDGKVSSINLLDRGRFRSSYVSTGPLISDRQWEINLILQAKDTDNDWLDINTFNVNANQKIDIEALIPSNGYKIFRIIRKDNIKINTQLQINNILYGNYGNYSNKVKAIPFYFNDGNKFIILLSDGFISIYKNDNIVASIQAETLKEEYFEFLKYTQYENTIIFTHTNMQPQKLEKTTSGWKLQNFELLNIPYHAFGGEKGDNINYATLTPTIEEGKGFITSNTDFFTKESVGQIIDGNGGRFKITDFNNKRKVFGYTIIPFYDKNGFSNFKYINNFEKVWSEVRGYPNCCLFYQERLWLGGSKERPLTLWGSRLNQFNDFNNIGNYDGDSINVDLSSRENNEIVNLYGNRGLQVFTGGAEFIVSEGSLTPNNITITQTSSVGSNKKIEPIDIAGTTLFIDKKGLNLNTFIYNYEQATYNSSALTLLNNQIIDKPTSLAIDYNSNFENGNFVYIVNSNGKIALANILPDQNINSFTRFETNNGKIIDCVILNDETYFLVNRNDLIFLEKLERVKTDFTTSQIINNSQLITGLYDYNEMIVRVYNDNKDYGLYEVKNGTIELKEIITDNVFIGLDIDCELESNNISINGNTNNIKSRIAKAVITTNNTKELILNNQKSKSNNNIFEVLSVTGWEVQNKFKIKSSFENLEIKSILLYINYGR